MSRLRGGLAAVLLTLSPALSAGDIVQITAADLRAELDGLEDQVVLLNFWATWCRPCLEEIPIFMRLEDELAPRGFRLVTVSLDDIESLDTQVRPFVEKWFPEFDTRISVEYEMRTMVNAVDTAWNEILPTSYLIDRDGNTIERIQGKLTEEEFRALITAALAVAER